MILEDVRRFFVSAELGYSNAWWEKHLNGSCCSPAHCSKDSDTPFFRVLLSSVVSCDYSIDFLHYFHYDQSEASLFHSTYYPYSPVKQLTSHPPPSSTQFSSMQDPNDCTNARELVSLTDRVDYSRYWTNVFYWG